MKLKTLIQSFLNPQHSITPSLKPHPLYNSFPSKSLTLTINGPFLDESPELTDKEYLSSRMIDYEKMRPPGKRERIGWN